MSNPLAVVVGFIGKLPVAGMSFYNLHYICGLQELGYEVHYVERQNRPDECYNPVGSVFSDDTSFALNYLSRLLPDYRISRERFSFIDRQERCHGSGWKALERVLAQADFVLTIADRTWFDELERCPRRAFVDGDPVFTQVAILTEAAPELVHYDTLFSYATRIGKPDCTVPPAGLNWIPTRPVVSTRLWDLTPASGQLPVTTVMNWAAWGDVEYNSLTYGHKNREFERFIDLPKHTAQPFALAAGGPVPRELLKQHGWGLVDPLEATGTIQAYQKFIAGSRADFGIAKHAYVASRCGWFSDRSTCYLAAGRPVLHQETGFTDWLPVGEGVFAFSVMDDVLRALRCLDLDYARHARAARSLAEDYFQASAVIDGMLADAGYR
jgi:hypothetical protein